MTPEERAQRRRVVIERLENGESYAAIGKDLGVSRQAIFTMRKQYQALGDDFFSVRRRGRSKERDHLTKAEKKRVRDWLDTHQPIDLGQEESDWSLASVKRAVFKLTSKRVNLEGAHGVLHYGKTKAERDAELRVPDEGNASRSTETESPPSDRTPPAAERTDDEDWDLPSLEEMQRLNEESWKSVAWEPSGPRGQSHGLRSGKHAKGKGSPVQKKKKKRKKR